MMSKFPDELTCDMAETYGIFDVKRLPARLAATLAVGLRDNSRVKRAKSKMYVDDNTMMLATIVDLLRGVESTDPTSMRGYYLGNVEEAQEQKTEHEIFDSPEAFKARWEEINKRNT